MALHTHTHTHTYTHTHTHTHTHTKEAPKILDIEKFELAPASVEASPAGCALSWRFGCALTGVWPVDIMPLLSFCGLTTRNEDHRQRLL
jgi:hypothetical protein